MLVVLFIFGAIFGGCAVIINQRMVELQTEFLRKKVDRLQDKLHNDRVEFESRNAYRAGYRDGYRANAAIKGRMSDKGVRHDGQGTKAEEKDGGGHRKRGGGEGRPKSAITSMQEAEHESLSRHGGPVAGV